MIKMKEEKKEISRLNELKRQISMENQSKIIIIMSSILLLITFGVDLNKGYSIHGYEVAIYKILFICEIIFIAVSVYIIGGREINIKNKKMIFYYLSLVVLTGLSFVLFNITTLFNVKKITPFLSYLMTLGIPAILTILFSIYIEKKQNVKLDILIGMLSYVFMSTFFLTLIKTSNIIMSSTSETLICMMLSLLSIGSLIALFISKKVGYEKRTKEINVFMDLSFLMSTIYISISNYGFTTIIFFLIINIIIILKLEETKIRKGNIVLSIILLSFIVCDKLGDLGVIIVSLGFIIPIFLKILITSKKKPL